MLPRIIKLKYKLYVYMYDYTIRINYLLVMKKLFNVWNYKLIFISLIYILKYAWYNWSGDLYEANWVKM